MAEFENHEKSELELFRREIVNKDGMIEMLENNIKELQEQLQNSYKRIEELNNVKVCECPPIVVSGVDGDGKPY
tara:strand:- start:230 stop:451 length:222 start_codon:yes stop_codon:yes gene_type:complete